MPTPSARRASPPSRPVRARRRTAVGLALLALLAAVPLPGPRETLAGTPYLADRWNLPGGANIPPFKKLVAVAITKNAPARRRFEDLFVSLLRGREAQGQTSYSIVADLEKPGETEKVLEALFAGGVDGVITARPVPLDGRKEEEWGAEWRAGLDTAVRLRPYVADSLQKLDAEASLHGIEFALWDVQSGQRLWAGRSTPVKLKKLQKSATYLVQDVMTQLIHEAWL